MARWRLRFLGTGASGGTPGQGRSRRRESSALLIGEKTILIDVTRDFPAQGGDLSRVDAILLTHAHRDASGGIGRLRTWWRERDLEPVPVFASRETIEALRRRYSRLEHCDFVDLEDGRRRRIGSWTISARRVPHAREAHYPTFAWRLAGDGKVVVYASDIGRLSPALERLCRGADPLVLDGAMWRRRIFSHLTIDEAVPEVCDWKVRRILLTQIGRSAPDHSRLEAEVRRLCHRARPAHDGLEIRL